LEVHAGGVAARPVEASDKTHCDRVAADSEHNWNGRGRGFGRQRRWRGARRGNHGRPPANQIGDQVRQPMNLPRRPAVFDRHALTFDVTSLV
jgi:hypothetical protein